MEERREKSESKESLLKFQRRKVVMGGGYGNRIFVIVSREISIKDKELLSFILCFN